MPRDFYQNLRPVSPVLKARSTSTTTPSGPRAKKSQLPRSTKQYYDHAMKTPRLLVLRWSDLHQMSHVVTLVNYLSSKKFDITVFTVAGRVEPPATLSSNVKLIALGLRSHSKIESIRNIIKAAVTLRGVITRESWDILYIIDSWTIKIYAISALLSSAQRRLRLVYHTYDWLEPGQHAWIYRVAEREICRRAAIVVNTDRARARLQQTLYSLRKQPLYIPNGLSLGTKVYARDSNLRSKLLAGEDSDESILLVYPTVASTPDSYQRRVLELILAFEFLPEEFKLLLFYGEGAYYNECKQTVARLCLERRVSFHLPTSSDGLMKILACADLGAILYNDEASSGYFMCNADKMSLFAANSIPFVASDYPNLEAVTYKNGIGVTCDAANPARIAEAIQNLACNPSRFRSMQRASRTAFEGALAFEIRGAKLATELHELAKVEPR